VTGRGAWAAEGIGTCFLVAAVVGSGIMAERLAGGSAALALLANSIATGAALVALILALGPVSGAHLNPAVTLVEALRGAITWPRAASYATAQVGGAFAGVALAHAMFEVPLRWGASHPRQGAGQFLAEIVATFGLIVVIRSCARHRPDAVAFGVGAYIAGAYWFTASTSFANPAVTLARAITDTFAGIRPLDTPAFLLAQLVGAWLAVAGTRLLLPRPTEPTTP
jgi:glycerol uptake facilitator-like aquaporin